MIIEAWEITPAMDSSFNSCVVRKSEDPEARKALEIAKDTLEQLWDSADLSTLHIKVSIKSIQIEESDIIDDND